MTKFVTLSTIVLLLISLNSLSFADSCPNFTGSYRFSNSMTVIFNQKSCFKIDVAWGSDSYGSRTPEPFSLVTSDFKKDPSQGFGASIMSYRYNIIGQSLVMSYKSDSSQQIEGYVFTVNKDGSLSLEHL